MGVDTLDPIVHCTVCPAALLVDSRDAATARLHHYGDGSHRLIPAPSPPGPVVFVEGSDVTVELLALSVRLRALADGLDEVLETFGIAR